MSELSKCYLKIAKLFYMLKSIVCRINLKSRKYLIILQMQEQHFSHYGIHS